LKLGYPLSASRYWLTGAVMRKSTKRMPKTKPPVVTRPGLLVVLSSPSGAGKTTVAGALLKREPNLVRSVSCTTRPKRKGEKDGKDYFFVTPAQFRSMIRLGEFLEWAKVYRNYYGTPKAWIEAQTSRGRDVLFVIDIQGGQALRKARPDAVRIFLEPPSWRVLVKRLTGRGTEDPEAVRIRLKTAVRELAEAPRYDFRVVADRPAWAAARIGKIIRRARQSRKIGLFHGKGRRGMV